MSIADLFRRSPRSAPAEPKPYENALHNQVETIALTPHDTDPAPTLADTKMRLRQLFEALPHVDPGTHDALDSVLLGWLGADLQRARAKHVQDRQSAAHLLGQADDFMAVSRREYEAARTALAEAEYELHAVRDRLERRRHEHAAARSVADGALAPGSGGALAPGSGGGPTPGPGATTPARLDQSLAASAPDADEVIARTRELLDTQAALGAGVGR